MPALFRPPWAPNPAERLASRPAEQLRRNPERKLTARARGYGRDWEGLRAVILAEEPMCWEWPDTESGALPTQSTMLFQSARYPSAGLMPPTCSPCAGRATTTKSIPAMAISVTVTANQIKKPNDWFSTFSEPVEVTSMPRRTSKKPRPSKAQAECPLVDADGVMSPYLSIMNRATPLISKLAAQMGFRPVARTTLCADDDVS